VATRSAEEPDATTCSGRRRRRSWSHCPLRRAAQSARDGSHPATERLRRAVPGLRLPSSNAPKSPAARRSLARLAKREGDFNLACELWKDALGNSRHGYEAYEQLAIYYEHKARDPERARQIVLRPIDELRRANRTGDIAPGAYREIKARFDRRMERLERRNRRPLLDALAMQVQA